MDQRTYVVKPMLPRLILAASLVAIMAFGGVRAFAADEPKETGPFARGFGYLGAFFVTQSRTELGLFSNDLPLGTRLNLEEDLGLRDSFAVPRMTVGWRFGQRHILSGSYYDLSRDAVRRPVAARAASAYARGTRCRLVVIFMAFGLLAGSITAFGAFGKGTEFILYFPVAKEMLSPIF